MAKKAKNLSICISLLKDLQKPYVVGSEQHSSIERIKRKLKRLQRNGAFNHQELLLVVREIAEVFCRMTGDTGDVD
jgi:hypothetical protein